MSTFAITSTRSSPGATTLAVALGYVWQEKGLDPLLVEADPAGGIIGLRFDLAAEPSLATLSADLRHGYQSDRFVRNAVDVNRVRTLLSPPDPLTSSRVLERNAGVFAAAFAAYSHPTIIDIGRLTPTSPALPLAGCADRVLLVARPVVEEVQSALYGIRLLRTGGCPISLVLVGDRPYHPVEVADLAGVHLAAVLPDDRALAAAFGGGRYSARGLKRSLLWRSVSALADSLLATYPLDQQTVGEQTVSEAPPSVAEAADDPAGPSPQPTDVTRELGPSPEINGATR